MNKMFKYYSSFVHQTEQTMIRSKKNLNRIKLFCPKKIVLDPKIWEKKIARKLFWYPLSIFHIFYFFDQYHKHIHFSHCKSHFSQKNKNFFIFLNYPYPFFQHFYFLVNIYTVSIFPPSSHKFQKKAIMYPYPFFLIFYFSCYFCTYTHFIS